MAASFSEAPAASFTGEAPAVEAASYVAPDADVDSCLPCGACTQAYFEGGCDDIPVLDGYDCEHDCGDCADQALDYHEDGTCSFKGAPAEEEAEAEAEVPAAGLRRWPSTPAATRRRTT